MLSDYDLTDEQIAVAEQIATAIFDWFEQPGYQCGFSWLCNTSTVWTFIRQFDKSARAPIVVTALDIVAERKNWVYQSGQQLDDIEFVDPDSPEEDW